MVEGLENLTAEQPGLAELRDLLEGLEWGRQHRWRFVSQEALQPRSQRVFRLRFVSDGDVQSFIAKRLEPGMARRAELAACRWLPAIGLGRACPTLLGSTTNRDGSWTWHVYQDLGPWQLNVQRPDPKQLHAAVALLARIHTRFAGHALLSEVRLHGIDYGIHFFQTSVQDAIRALEAVKPPLEHHELCARLLQRLGQLREEFPARAEALADLGGPETLLHGDLWAINLFVLRNQTGFDARLIDWDRVGVGPASYDLSTLLLRFPQQDRSWLLRLYEEEAAEAGWQLPDTVGLNLLFETAELARYANGVIWPAIGLAQDRAEWGFEQLAEVERWFKELRPVLGTETAVPETAPAL